RQQVPGAGGLSPQRSFGKARTVLDQRARGRWRPRRHHSRLPRPWLVLGLRAPRNPRLGPQPPGVATQVFGRGPRPNGWQKLGRLRLVAKTGLSAELLGPRRLAGSVPTKAPTRAQVDHLTQTDELEELNEFAGRAVQPQGPAAVARNHVKSGEHIDRR